MAVTIVIVFTAAAGAEEIPREMTAIQIDQRLGNQVPLDAEFIESEGNSVRLGDLVGDRPVVLVLAYFRCPRLCSMVINNVIEGLAHIPPDAGKDYQVIVISFDPNESAKIAKSNRELAVLRYARGPTAADGWQFLTGTEENIRRVADAVGFHYEWDPNEQVYKHSAGIMILTREGKVASYLFGVRFEPRDLRLALTEASAGQIGAPADQALLLTCMAYDPASGKYTLNVLKIVRLASILTLLVLGLYLWRNLARERRRARSAGAGGARGVDSERAENARAAALASDAVQQTR